ncbi:WSC domain-containing protein [Phanerochaete sordida]|uniref:WSC domain-containing protein n=1 Tax=Phanerochaete sordida TaxID=48140 RepID=A0A9P3G6I9_9APHY|nr:WSC domain-containing protein [Phanerochaete sordida]
MPNLALSSLSLLLIAFGLALAGPPCPPERPVVMCSPLIRPYSDNAYFWAEYCELDAPSNVLIADSDQPYDADTDYCAEFLEPTYYPTCCAYKSFCAGVDCDGPETGLLGPGTDQFAQGWVIDIPCAVDVPSRVLANAVVSYSNDTARPLTCTTHCASLGYTYAGIEYGNECYCGTGYADGLPPSSAPASDCSMRCLAGYYWTCGGSWRMQIYKYDPYA